MKKATLAQGAQILNLIQAKNIPLEQLQQILASGLVSDLLDAHIAQIDRNKFRKLCGLRPINAAGYDVWKTISLGTDESSSPKAFEQAMSDAGVIVSEDAKDILYGPNFTASNSQTEVDLAVLSNIDLGFQSAVGIEKIFRRIKELGFELCSPEVGPQLRLQHMGQRLHSELCIAMQPIVGQSGHLRMFTVGNFDQGLSLRALSHPEMTTHAGKDFVVVRPRK